MNAAVINVWLICALVFLSEAMFSRPTKRWGCDEHRSGFKRIFTRQTTGNWHENLNTAGGLKRVFRVVN